MADTKITALAAITTVDPAADVLPIVDISDTSMAASGTTKKITSNQILGAGGTATLASATITGDLTVDTSTLKVDSANNRVGIGTASPTQVLTVRGNVLTTAAAGTDSYANVSTDGVQNSYLGFNNSGSTNAAGASNNNTYIGNGNNYGTQIVGNSNILASFGTTGVFNWYDGAGGTRMTLNATGLGVATTAYSGTKLTVLGVSYFSGGASSTEQIRLGYTDGTSYWGIGRDNVTTGNLLIGNGSTRLTIDANGNVGIGVAGPSYRLQVNVATGGDRNIFAAQVTGASNGLQVQWNNGTQKLRVNFSDLPTSSAGLPANTLWVDTAAGNTLKLA